MGNKPYYSWSCQCWSPVNALLQPPGYSSIHLEENQIHICMHDHHSTSSRYKPPVAFCKRISAFYSMLSSSSDAAKLGGGVHPDFAAITTDQQKHKCSTMHNLGGYFGAFWTTLLNV